MDATSIETKIRPMEDASAEAGHATQKLAEIPNDSTSFTDQDATSKILQLISDDELKEKLSSLLSEKNKALEEFRNAYHCARNDAIEARDRLNKVETELMDTRSAAALANQYHNDAIQTLKRQRDEELASFRVLSAQYPNIYKSSERFEEPVSTAYSSQPPAPTKSITQNMTTSNHQPDRRSSQTFTNQALDTVEKMARRVGLKGLGNNPFNIKSNNSASPNQEISSLEREKFQDLIESYESEISHLRRVITDAGIALPSSISPPNSPGYSSHTASQSPNQPVSQTASKSNHSGLPNTTDSLHLVNSTSENSSNSQASEAASVNAQAVDYLTNEVRELKNSLHVKTKDLKLALERQDELENKLKTQTTEQANKIRNLESVVTKLEKQLESIKSNYQAHRDAVQAEISTLIQEREDSEDKLVSLRSHYDALLGRRSKAAAELSAQPIHLPDDRSDLELLALSLKEENISFRAAREHLEERLESESQSYKEQLLAEQQERAALESMLQSEIKELKSKLSSLNDAAKERDQEVDRRQNLQEEHKVLQQKFTELQSKYDASESALTEIREQKLKLQHQVIQLQSDLDNAESVQADFVHLSQNLQVQLEKFRQQEEKVRWVHPDDASSCSSCQSNFPTGSHSNSHKGNCSHCGQIFCTNCLKKSMSTGPHNRLVPVCDVCYTLLNKHVAPYFSTASLRTSEEHSDSPRRLSLSISSPRKSTSISNK